MSEIKRSDSRDDDYKESKEDRRPRDSNRSDEGRRNTKWVSFSKSKPSFGFQHLSSAFVPSMGSDSSGLAVCFEKIAGWHVPAQIIKEFGKDNFDINIQLSFSLYHVNSATFFGSTWMGPSISLGSSPSKNNKIIDFEYVEIVYMLSKITDPSCVGVIEIVVSKFDSKKNLTVAQFGCGFAILNLFAKPAPPDVLSGHENVDVTSCSMYYGSPRDLIMNSDIKSIVNKLKPIPNCSLFFKLYSHRRLLKIRHFVAENECLGRFDVVAGLVSKSVVPQGATRERQIACIGDEEKLNEKNGVVCVPVRPILAASSLLKIANFQLFIPNRLSLEIKLLGSNKSSFIDPSKVQVLSRHLKIGLHNGHTILGGEWETYSLVQDRDDNDMLITDDPVLVLNGYVPNEYMAMVFLVQYEIGIPQPKVKHLDPTSMVRSINPPTRTSSTTVTVGSTIFIPSDGKTIWLKNTSRNVSSDDGGVDVELKLLKDEVSAILSPNVLMNDADASNYHDVDLAESKSSKNRLSLKADDKLRSSDVRGKKHLKEDVDTDPMVGFDLKMFHSVLGEVLHNDNIENLLKMENKGREVSGKLNVVEDAVQEIEEAESRNESSEHDARDKRPKDSGFTRTRVSKSRYNENIDDNVSEIAESIVSGSSEMSAYRLDPSYYYTQRGQDGRNDNISVQSAELDRFTGRIGLPKDRNSLLANAIQSKLVPSTKDQNRGDILEPQKFVDLKVAPISRIGIGENASHTRELTRGAKSRLNRHGFHQVITDTAANLQKEGSQTAAFKNVVVDIDLEARDSLSLHEIRIQFAGYRSGKYQVDADSEGVSNFAAPFCPKRVYASYQFYTCLPTKTEIMRLIGAKAGETCVFIRDDRYGGDETPLVLRYVIDCSVSSPTEATEFSEYLAHNSLYVDLWDADSLLLIGTFAIPLRKLLRQGKSVVNHSIECDVINADIGSNIQGGITTCVVADGGPVSGAVVGAVQVIVSNYGQKGAKPVSVGTEPAHQHDSVNWRAFGVENIVPNTLSGASRPKNSVRARPLSESAPQLEKVLQDLRGTSHRGSSMRSLTATRGGSGTSTLTYDEVAVLFKRFQGVSKGTVQYAGDFISLLDVPSWNVASRKLVKAFELFGSKQAVEKEMLRHSDANSRLEENDVEAFLRVLFDKTRMFCRPEDFKLMAARFVAEGQNGCASVPQIMSFCESESDRQKWSVVSRRFRAAVQSAYIDGEDVEQRLSDHDSAGEHFIGKEKFVQFLEWLSSFGKHITSEDIKLCCRHFVRTNRESNGKVSLKEFMAFVGKEYVGNLQIRIQRHIKRIGKNDCKYILSLISRVSSNRALLSFSEVEDVFKELGVFSEITHDQLRRILGYMDFKKHGKISLKQILNYLDVEYTATDLDHKQSPRAEPEMNIEDMLRLLLAKVQSNGIEVDEAFRHFDTNGDGQISIKELEKALSDLCIFAHIPNWKDQLPELIAKFDTSGDKEVSLKEFFQFLGLSNNYAPNIIQKMTKIFAVASQKGLSIKAIFAELDDDGNGKLDVDELMSGLKKIGTFGDITLEDAQSVVAKFDDDGDKKISIDEFVQFFSERVNRVVKQRRLRQAERKPVVMQFRDVMTAAKAKGATVQQIFGHIDKDKGGSISKSEFKAVLMGMPHFKELPAADLDEVFSIIDYDNSGDITLQEFEQFVDGTVANSVATRTKVAEDNFKNRVNLVDQVRDVFKTAESKGLSFENAFSLADKDGSGLLNVKELELTLRKLPAFRDVAVADIKSMFDIIDTDHSGQISVDEFKSFLKHGQVIAEKRQPSPREERSLVSNEETSTEIKNRVIQFTKRILAHDKAFFARLDQDEDGLIEVVTLMNSFRREGLFKGISEDRVEDVLDPFRCQRKFIALDQFMNFIDGRTIPAKQHHHDESKDAIDDGDSYAKEYVFSANPEIKALEKKIRTFGKVLSKRSVDVEEMFRSLDSKSTGMITRSQLIEVLCRLGMYVLEQGKTFEQALAPSNDISRAQIHQINKLKGTGGDYLHNAPRMARRLLINGGNGPNAINEFSEHLESMSLVNSYRQSQKQMLLQRVLSYNLEKTIKIFPRFGRALFFEYPITNPFAHEERFEIDIQDPELQLITSYDEWIHFRNTCRPCVGELGMEPVEAEMFDKDGQGKIQIVLLPHETLHIPLTFLTLLPYTSSVGQGDDKMIEDSKSNEETKSGFNDSSLSDSEIPRRKAEIKIISGSHGHVVSVLRVLIYPRPFALNRTLRFFEPENTILKRRILLVGHENMSIYPGEFTSVSKYIHCVENNNLKPDGSEMSRVVVEWGPSSEHFTGLGSLDILIRYRCAAFPNSGSFYLLIYNDPYQSHLHEIWQIVVQTRQKIDVHGIVGSVLSTDLVVKGDRYARRVKAFCANSLMDKTSCHPEGVFQLVPGAYNRISFNLMAQSSGYRRLELSLVDVDSKELISAWLLSLSVSPPAVVRTYDVEVLKGRTVHKKIIYTNPWDVSRRFTLTSSDESVMRPRNKIMDVPPRGSAFMRLWFSYPVNLSSIKEAHLFLSDEDGGQNEECYLFKIRSVS